MSKQKVLIACSGGPDSMSLLDMYKDKKEVYVCHINYHQRKTAKRDENIVKDYCNKRNIPFYKFDYRDNKKGNFQKLARDFRYNCFKKVCLKNDIKVVYVAHQMEDNIETYLMQLKRNTSVSYYGIAKSINLNGIKIYRPLLGKTKEQLIKYLKKNNIDYGIDESNNTNKYERNRVRHELVDKMSIEEKRKIVSLINSKNVELMKEFDQTNSFISSNNKYKYEEFINFKYFDTLLRTLLYRDLSNKYIREIKKSLSSKKNIELNIKNKVICKEYNHVYVYDKPKKYSYLLKTISYKKFNYFKISSKGNSINGAFLRQEDFPITIRSFNNGDSIKMRYGTKKINRFFIDNKISSFDRKIWPIILNKKGDVVLVPGIGCNIEHYSKRYNIYVLKLSYYEVNNA